MPARQILIVDDQRSVRKFIISLLHEVEGEFLEAENGRVALETLERTGPLDMVISDVDMPLLDGLALCETLKRSERFRAMPVVIVSSFDSELDVERGFQAGAHTYIPKAEVQAKLPGVVRGILDQYEFRKQQTIMVVDDSESIRLMLSGALARAGFLVVTAENGRQAADQLAFVRPELILSDITMPEMDGYALFHWLRSQPDLKDIPFVVMSVHNEHRYIARMVEQGAAAYLIKPFAMTELVLTIDRLLSDQFRLLLKEREKLAVERGMLLASISSLVSALEARDAYTKGHSMAVAKVVTAMAQLAGMSTEESERVMIAAQLHDIGKIGIRDHILLKQGALTTEEFATVRTHPVIGSAIIATVPSLSAIVPVVRSHHERFDGKGYPDGLRGEAIPRMARMIAVADTYDAMISNRPYRDGFVIEHTLKTIRNIRGTQLCPESVDLFFRWIDQCSLPLTPPRELPE
jgi:response regulator RpfG family c-di-GMP phosphodiesterase